MPEPAAPAGRRVSLIAAIGAIVVAMLLSATGVYVWQHGVVTDRNATIATLQQHVTRLDEQILLGDGRLATAQQTVTNQQERIGALAGRNAWLRARYQIAVGNEQATQQTLMQTLGQLQAANETLRTMVGPPLADGTYVAFIMAAGVQQAPPRLVIDRAKMVPGQGLVNELPAWRTVEVSKTASVVVLSLRPFHPQAISLDRFGHLYVNPAPWADRVTHVPFRVVVSGGVVTSIRELRAPA